MDQLTQLLNKKVIECEDLFANAGTNPDMIFLDGMLKHGVQTNALLMAIGRRQAYVEIIEYIRKNKGDQWKR